MNLRRCVVILEVEIRIGLSSVVERTIKAGGSSSGQAFQKKRKKIKKFLIICRLSVDNFRIRSKRLYAEFNNPIFRRYLQMKTRILLSVAAVFALTVSAFAQDCAPCAPACQEVSCQATCAAPVCCVPCVRPCAALKARFADCAAKFAARVRACKPCFCAPCACAPCAPVECAPCAAECAPCEKVEACAPAECAPCEKVEACAPAECAPCAPVCAPCAKAKCCFRPFQALKARCCKPCFCAPICAPCAPAECAPCAPACAPCAPVDCAK